MALSDYPIVDDSKAHSPAEFGRGYISRDYSAHPLGDGLKAGSAMPSLTLAEIKERVKEKTAKGEWIADLCDKAGLTVKDQNGFKFCWNYAVTHSLEVCYIVQGGTKKVLSGQQNACLINGYRDAGGSGIVAVKYNVKHGCCTEAIWPKNSMSQKYDTEEARKNALLHRIVEWDDLDPRDKLAIWTRLVNDIPVTVGIPAMGHEMLLTGLVLDDGNLFEIADNSWKPSWGNNGRCVVRGSHAHFDEAGAIRSVTPSVN